MRNILKLKTNQVFVFGSNESGIHGGGAARTAKDHYGAVMGKSYGHYGQSFAIPTKDRFIETMPLERIQKYVTGFLAFAEGNPKKEFIVSQIGCGLAGLQPFQIAPMFRLDRADTLPNILFDKAWERYLCVNAKFWGTFP